MPRTRTLSIAHLPPGKAADVDFEPLDAFLPADVIRGIDLLPGVTATDRRLARHRSLVAKKPGRPPFHTGYASGWIKFEKLGMRVDARRRTEGWPCSISQVVVCPASFLLQGVMSARSPGPADWQPCALSVRLSAGRPHHSVHAGRNGVGRYRGDLYLTIC